MRLGIPWLLRHYHRINGFHPLVRSFIQGNSALDPVQVHGSATVDQRDVHCVAQKFLAIAAQIPEYILPTYRDWLCLPEQAIMQAQASEFDALFLHTTPLYLGNAPWIFHFESFSSLFWPCNFHGISSRHDILSQPMVQNVLRILEAPQCVRIFSHMKSSISLVESVFQNESIARKMHYVPLGIGVRAPGEIRDKFRKAGPLRILFTNSMHGDPFSFYLRGGHHLIEAFLSLKKNNVAVELTVLSSVPSDLSEHFSADDLAEINWIKKRIDDDELDELLLSHHVFALPSAGLHSYSMLRALAYGCVPIVSDFPGYEQFTQGIEASVLQIQGIRNMIFKGEAAGWNRVETAEFRPVSAEIAGEISRLLEENGSMATLEGFAVANAEHCRLHFSQEASHAAFNRMLVC